ncbi:hypothetical protein LOD99_3119 [Oopsacas minuta]|uniref:UBR-type domain-containing protein n=1 Tax=Oopsacas minuta TaxID=111878 RepID=A0AAV7JY37_9METZ|nr:hypothetical protein LOD99_3119 [Oopsacas minuta]
MVDNGAKFHMRKSNQVSQLDSGDETWVYSYEPEKMTQSQVWLSPGEDPPTKVVLGRSTRKQMVTKFFGEGSHIATTTEKEELKQHSYHCHTCKMTKAHGICTTCAKVCHKGHDLSYSRFSPIICSCGSRGNHSCNSLTSRIGDKTSDVKTDPTTDGFGINSSHKNEDGFEIERPSIKG